MRTPRVRTDGYLVWSCEQCGHELTIPDTDENAVLVMKCRFPSEGGVLVQDAFPSLSPEEREQMISGICGKCFDSLFEGG